MAEPTGPAQGRDDPKGVALGLGAYLIWGFFPVFFKALSGVAPDEVLAHRILWSFASLCLYTLATRSWPQVRSAFTTPRTLATLCCSTLLISLNWFVFIVAVNTGRVLEASLGYFITPLISVLLGGLLLKERLRPVQAASVLLAALGVLVKTLSLGHLPVMSLVLAVSFGAYGLARKLTPAGGVTALTVETALLTPLALGYAIHLALGGQASFLAGPLSTDVLLVSAGVITAIPLALYGAAVRRLRLATVGVLQYLVPTLQFLLAVYYYDEPFQLGHLFAFSLIWAGLAAYTWDTFRSLKQGAKLPKGV